ncbi:hypothetical protein L873DRAFT_1794087 [Choiromyces venosus 120613-1]|uniref:CBF1-interacting co-repressor CIR N-terminal domain-containing protein n=1 Tax=Choiromyces venosus 120613-1 TaxID=1336337 RepID=A0A3N4J3H1_9PEZI|nr:hypothetical protein L873DRAFT_1794087 [Choiromyces venosus 120613-1]
MPLHLLHHKSYHVYSSENIARVRRDEAAAAARAAADDARLQAADSEARIDLLRARAGGAVDSPIPPNAKPEGPKNAREVALVGEDGHVNFFSAASRGRSGNAEREKEKKEVQERDDGALGRMVGERRPWYASVGLVSGREEMEMKGDGGGKKEWKGRREERRKDAGDPLAVIKRGVSSVKEVRKDREEWKRRREVEVGLEREKSERHSGDRKRRRSHSRSRSRSRSPGRHDRRRHHSHSRSHSDTHPRSRHHNSRHRSRSPPPSSSSSNPSLDHLRREKSARESAERRKAAALLAKAKEDSEPGWKAVPGGRYSSQFGYLV